MTVYRLHLTTQERLTLESWVKKDKHTTQKVQQSQILLNSDENFERKSSTLLKDILGLSVKTIERVRRQFCQERMGMFIPKPRKTRSDKKVDGRIEAHLTTLLCQSPPNNKPKWALKYYQIDLSN